MDHTSIDVESAFTKKLMSMSNLPKPLTLEEKKYLLAVERGDMPNVRRILQKAHRHHHININCVDSLGRGALSLSIDGENLEMVELLVIMGVQTKDGLLHAINAEFVEAVELLLEHEELIHKEGEPYSWQTVDLSTATFTPDITPLILAAHRNNYEILKILLDRGATIPMPHDIKCGCDDCIRESKEDSLRHSLSRLNEYRALASPSLIALSSSDPILTAFQLSWELRNLAFAEPECKSEYLELRKQCQQFAVDLLHQSRSSQELAIILNHDPDSPPYQEGEHMKLTRLELAITYKQKKFVAHPNIQQLLAAIWYEGVPGFRRKSTTKKIIIIIRTAILFPLYCMLYMFAPNTHSGKLMRKPFMKFLTHASSYLFFLLIIILVSQRAEDQIIEFFGSENMKAERLIKQRGIPPAILEYVVLIYVMGYIYEETYEIYVEGIQSYLRNLWNFIDFTRNFLYCLVFLLRVVAYIQQTNEIAKDPSTAYIPREQWNAFDPQLIAEGLFAAANIFSALKLVHLFSINPHLGPLQISLGRMVIDIVKFFFIYSLVLFAFACGLNQLLWYFSDLERKKCYGLPNGEPDWEHQSDSCMKWRSFANVFESSQSLFWASFGMVDLSNFELTGIKSYTRFWGLLMFGSYSVINVIVLLNLLIAMMSNSYAMIDEHSDTEWKFARTKLWMSYFEEGNTLPPPFNIFPTVKTFLKFFHLRKKDKLRRMSTKRRNKEEKERDYKYTSVMRALVWRYISSMHKKCEEDAVTEDDINEVKSDISAFRYDILEVLNNNGMDISSVEKGDKAVLGKKMKIWERQLMKDFKVAPVVTDEEAEQLRYEPPPENEDALSKFRRVAKLAVLNSNLHKWGQVVTGACLASQIGHCSNKDSFKKQQNLMKAMKEARQYISRSPLPASRSSTPIELPDTTGQSIIELLKEIKDPNDTKPADKTTLKVSSMKNPLQPNVLIKQHPSISLSPPTPTLISKTIGKTEGEENIPLNSIPESSESADSSSPSDLAIIKEVGDFISLESHSESPQLKLTDDISPISSEDTLTKGDESETETEKTLTGHSENIGTSEDDEPKNLLGQQQSSEIQPETSDQGPETSSAVLDKKVTETLKDVSEDIIPKTDLQKTQTSKNEKVEKLESKSSSDQDQSKTTKDEDGSDPVISGPQTEEAKLDKKDEQAIKTEISEKDKGEEIVLSVKPKSRKGQAPAVPEIKVKEDSPKASSPATEKKPQAEDSNKIQSNTKAKDSIAKPDNIDGRKSPMAARNITRIGDKSGRRLPKTGWL